MSTNTYVAIETQTLSSTAASVTFNSISQSYTDLVLVVNAKSVAGGVQLLRTRVGNGSIDTATNYSCTWIGGTGSVAFSSRDTSSNSAIDMRISDSAWSAIILQFQNYSNTTTYKTFFTRSNNASDEIWQGVNLWRSTSAINTIQVFPDGSQSFATGSTFTLYGIANSNLGAPKAFGGIVTQDATYTYHTFGASGTFTPQQSLTVDYLVVAGGGPGGGGAASGNNSGGGGGAGGYLTSIGGSPLSVTATPYSITVGSGGAGTTGQGASGGNSVFSTITSTGGGAGGSNSSTSIYINGLAGGSGGGGSSHITAGSGGAASPAGQGNAGGNGSVTSPNYGGGGGGGASISGTAGTSTAGGAGGNGLSSLITGTSITRAGGGGGATYQGGTPGTGGSGGGGNGSLTGSATAGSINTGSGGGGNYTSGAATGGNGGSGIVIIRYAN